MSKTVRIVLAAVVAVVAIGGFTAWWFLRDTAPDELSVDDVAEQTTTTASGSSDGSTTTGAAGAGLDGTWAVVEGDETQAGLRIDEEFVGGAVTHTAVGRTSGVDGSVTIDGTEASDGSFTVDLTQLEWSDSPGFPTDNRSRAIADQGLETSRFPEGTFELTEPVDFGEVPDDGGKVTIDVTGDLTLHGVTNEVTFSIEAVRRGDDLVIATADPVPVALADYDMTKPQSPSVASIADEGSFEFLVVLSKG